MTSPDDDRLLERLGHALAGPVADPSGHEVEGLRQAVARLAERLRGTSDTLPRQAAAPPTSATS
ncbi:MAG TPA: hypothetical protein VFH45_01470 [Acidimicrobiales bacterium]|nr:hypothetical protein [Acidimicrobiales bacterium]